MRDKSHADQIERWANFIKFWVNYMKTHFDKEWSKKQNVLINSVIKEH